MSASRDEARETPSEAPPAKSPFPANERDTFPSLYYAIVPDAKEVARGLGYALLLHGSMSRDLDLVAIPWTAEAAEPEALVEAVRAKFQCWIGDCRLDAEEQVRRGGRDKPHGRRAWSLHLGGHAFIDLSVMPRARETPAQGSEALTLTLSRVLADLRNPPDPTDAGWKRLVLDGPAPHGFGSRVRVEWEEEEVACGLESEATFPGLVDNGYLLGLPGFSDPELDGVVHIPTPDGGEKSVPDAEWVTLLRLLVLPRVKRVTVFSLDARASRAAGDASGGGEAHSFRPCYPSGAPSLRSVCTKCRRGIWEIDPKQPCEPDARPAREGGE